MILMLIQMPDALRWIKQIIQPISLCFFLHAEVQQLDGHILCLGTKVEEHQAVGKVS